MKRKILSLIMVMSMLLMNATVLAADNTDTKYNIHTTLTTEVVSPEFPNAYIITERIEAKDIDITVDGNNIYVRGTTQQAQDFVNKYVINNSRLKEELALKKGKLVGLVAATVFVEETYEKVDNKIIVTNSRLLSKDEVEAIGIENFKSLDTQKEPMVTTQGTVGNQRGTLTITFTCFDNSSGNSSKYLLWGDAYWSGMNWIYNPEQNPAAGGDFFGFAWAGDFSSSNLVARGYTNLGTSVPIYLADAVPNAGVVWEFKELILERAKYYIWVETVQLDVLLTKNVRTGGGNTTQAILKYIHTYDEPTGSVSISADPKSVGAGFTLQGTSKQWSIVCIMNGLYY